jgi:hypothetical protein
MKRLYNRLAGKQFLRVPLVKFNTYGYTIIAPAHDFITITDDEYRAVSPVNTKIWQVTHIDDSKPDTVEEVQSLITSGGGHTHSNKAVLDATTASFTSVLKTAYDAEIVNPISRLFYTDKNRTDSYTADGSAEKPFKTIAAALTRIVADSDRGSVPYSILLSSGTYAEEINLNSRGMFSITFVAQGRVAIVPTVGNALTATTDISALQDVHFYGIEFGMPVVMTGDGTANQFKNVNFRDCAFSGNANVTLTCMNSVAIWNVYCENRITLSNVNYLYINGGQIQDTFSMEMNGANTAPNWGIVGGAILFNLITNAVSLLVSGAGAMWNMSAHSCRMGASAGAYSIPASCNVSLYNSLFRGTWTNSGVMALKNSHVENTVVGTVPVFTANKSAYVNYTAATPANWSAPAPTNVNNAIDRLAVAVVALKGGPIT